MSEFSIQDAAFTGFRVVREHPMALVVWAVYALALSVVMSVIIVAMMGPDFARLATFGGAAPDVAEMLAVFTRLAPGYATAMIVGLASNAILGAAMIRAVLRPADDRFGFLRLGADELRQFALAALTILVFMAAVLLLTIVESVLTAVAAAAAPTAAPLIGLILFLPVLAALVFLGVRLSLAPALTFDRMTVDLFGSWTLTRGRFWPLFGTYLLTVALLVVVYLLCLLVIYAAGAVLGFAGPSTPPPDLRSLKAYFTPWLVTQTVLGAGASALVWPVLLTPPTAIYRALARTGPAAADAFS